MTHPRRTYTDVIQILRDWITDGENTVRRSTARDYIADPAMQAHVRELERNLPRARKALRAMTETL